MGKKNINDLKEKQKEPNKQLKQYKMKDSKRKEKYLRNLLIIMLGIQKKNMKDSKDVSHVNKELN